MIIQKPISFKPNPNDPRSTRLFFRDQKAADFYMVGSVAWPDDIYPGFVLLSGQNLNDPEKKILLFEEQEFWTIDNWTNPDGMLKDMPGKQGYWYGLTHFLNNMLARYGARTYFYGGQHPDINQRHLMQLYGSKITPRPIDMIEVPYVKEVGAGLVREYTRLKRFFGDSNSRLSELMKSVDVDKNNGDHAIRCLFAGYEYVPWVDLNVFKPVMRYG